MIYVEMAAGILLMAIGIAELIAKAPQGDALFSFFCGYLFLKSAQERNVRSAIDLLIDVTRRLRGY